MHFCQKITIQYLHCQIARSSAKLIFWTSLSIPAFSRSARTGALSSIRYVSCFHKADRNLRICQICRKRGDEFILMPFVDVSVERIIYTVAGHFDIPFRSLSHWLLHETISMHGVHHAHWACTYYEDCRVIHAASLWDNQLPDHSLGLNFEIKTYTQRLSFIIRCHICSFLLDFSQRKLCVYCHL